MKLKFEGVAEENIARPEPNDTKKIGFTAVVLLSEHKLPDSRKRAKITV